MSIGYKTIVGLLESHAQTTGIFQTVAGHEPKDAPTSTVHCAFYFAGLRPNPGASGLNTTSAVLTIVARIYADALSQPEDDIDPAVVAAADTLLGKYTTDHTLSSNLMTIDLLGMTGQALEARAGYITIGQKMFRTIDITIPCLLNDVWSQGS